MGSVIDSYNQFLDYFHIKKDDFYQFGIDSTFFPNPDKVRVEWDALKNRVFHDQVVYIRGYGRDAHGTEDYQCFYDFLFENKHIIKDPTNNARPQALIERLTGYKRNKTIYNYQVSHIWGHTKNPLLFESPWNICLTPKMFDPFTGHETKGNWPEEYQKMFLAKAKSLFQPYIDEYNSIINSLDLSVKLDDFLAFRADWDNNRVKQFKNDVLGEFEIIH